MVVFVAVEVVDESWNQRMEGTGSPQCQFTIVFGGRIQRPSIRMIARMSGGIHCSRPTTATAIEMADEDSFGAWSKEPLSVIATVSERGSSCGGGGSSSTPQQLPPPVVVVVAVEFVII